jgi:hypothetical protein
MPQMSVSRPFIESQLAPNLELHPAHLAQQMRPLLVEVSNVWLRLNCGALILCRQRY